MSKRSCEAAGSVEDALLQMARVNFHNAQVKVPQLRKKLDTLPQPDYHKQWNGESSQNAFLFPFQNCYSLHAPFAKPRLRRSPLLRSSFLLIKWRSLRTFL